MRVFGNSTADDIENEAKAVAALCSGRESKYVVDVIEHGWLTKANMYYFIDMEYCPKTLEDRILQWKHQSAPVAATQTFASNPDIQVGIAKNEELPEQTSEPILDIFLDITKGLRYIHGKGFVHRDLEPKNVLFSPRDNCWQLTDFGSAAMATSKALATTRSSRGTNCYRAPEVLSGRYNNRADLFALGCIIFRIVTGEMVFGSDWDVSEYARGLRPPIFPDRWPSAELGTKVSDIGILASDLLTIDPTQRPGAGQTESRIYRIRQSGWVEIDFDPTADAFFDVDGGAPNNDGPIGHPTVQSGLKFAGPNALGSSTSLRLEDEIEPFLQGTNFGIYPFPEGAVPFLPPDPNRSDAQSPIPYEFEEDWRRPQQ